MYLGVWRLNARKPVPLLAGGQNYASEVSKSGFARAKKAQKIDVLVLACLEDAQQCQVVGYAPLVCSSVDVIAHSPTERFDGVLGIVVVPWNVVVIQEGEQLPAMFLEPRLKLSSRRGFISTRHDGFKESVHVRDVLL